MLQVRSGPEPASNPSTREHYAATTVSKKTVKRRLRKKKKANHGKKPNCGRG
jgi:hypothetical protein